MWNAEAEWQRTATATVSRLVEDARLTHDGDSGVVRLGITVSGSRILGSIFKKKQVLKVVWFDLFFVLLWLE